MFWIIIHQSCWQVLLYVGRKQMGCIPISICKTVVSLFIIADKCSCLDNPRHPQYIHILSSNVCYHLLAACVQIISCIEGLPPGTLILANWMFVGVSPYPRKKGRTHLIDNLYSSNSHDLYKWDISSLYVIWRLWCLLFAPVAKYLFCINEIAVLKRYQATIFDKQ